MKRNITLNPVAVTETKSIGLFMQFLIQKFRSSPCGAIMTRSKTAADKTAY